MARSTPRWESRHKVENKKRFQTGDCDVGFALPGHSASKLHLYGGVHNGAGVSELRDIVLAAIDGGARDRAAIIEATGLEERQVSNLLFNLKAAGAIAKDDEGYSRAGAPPPKRRTHEAVEPEAAPEAPKPQRCKRRRKANGAAVPVPITACDDAVPPVGFARFGEYVVLRMDDLAELVQLLERWRPIAELTRR